MRVCSILVPPEPDAQQSKAGGAGQGEDQDEDGDRIDGEGGNDESEDVGGDDSVCQMKVSELRDALKQRGLDSKGKKAELIERLQSNGDSRAAVGRGSARGDGEGNVDAGNGDVNGTQHVNKEMRPQNFIPRMDAKATFAAVEWLIEHHPEQFIDPEDARSQWALWAAKHPRSLEEVDEANRPKLSEDPESHYPFIL